MPAWTLPFVATCPSLPASLEKRRRAMGAMGAMERNGRLGACGCFGWLGAMGISDRSTWTFAVGRLGRGLGLPVPAKKTPPGGGVFIS